VRDGVQELVVTGQFWHEIGRRVLDMWALVLLRLGVSNTQIAHTIAWGALVAAIALAAVAVLSLFDSLAVQVAARRIEALAARADLPPRDRLARPFLYAFRHSARLARWAGLELSSSSRDQPKQNGRNGDAVDDPSSALALSERVTGPAALPDVIVRAPSHFFTAAIIVGGIGLMLADAIIAFGPRLFAAVPDNNQAVATILHLTLLSTMSAGGVGLTGLASPLLLWPLSILARRSRDRLQVAVKDCVSAAANAPAPPVRSRDLRTVREIARLRQRLDEQSRARAEDSERLAQAIGKMQEITRLWQEANDIDGRGIVQAVRQLALGVVSLHERVEASQSQHSPLQISESDRSIVAALSENVGRLAPLLDCVRDGEMRILEMTRKLTEAAEAAERSLRYSTNTPAAGEPTDLQPAIDELKELMSELMPSESRKPAGTLDDRGGDESR
jgi:hypothetical protein